MHKCLTVSVIIALLIGCRDASDRPDVNHAHDLPAKGRFLVPQEELPRQVVELAGTLETLPSISSESELRATLTNCGLNKEPDDYKDFGHFWFLDGDFKSETDPKKRLYRVAIGHVPRPANDISFYFATISREYLTEPWRETLWEANWPLESAD